MRNSVCTCVLAKLGACNAQESAERAADAAAAAVGGGKGGPAATAAFRAALNGHSALAGEGLASLGGLQSQIAALQQIVILPLKVGTPAGTLFPLQVNTVFTIKLSTEVGHFSASMWQQPQSLPQNQPLSLVCFGFGKDLKSLDSTARSHQACKRLSPGPQ